MITSYMADYPAGRVLLASQQPAMDAPQATESMPCASIGAFGGLAKKKPLAHRAAASARTFFDSADYALSREKDSTHSASKACQLAPATPQQQESAQAVLAHWQSLVEQQQLLTVTTAQQGALTNSGSPYQHYTPGTQPLFRGARRASRLSLAS
ncbi:hypothetical protein COO60DRAFT_1614782 [Scenedesmus sp. NREL 46B-D3]|nr:hypothetical protein COO60DRAFT_1614782 [Scenedesmus sp. NREL 46B-D3]